MQKIIYKIIYKIHEKLTKDNSILLASINLTVIPDSLMTHRYLY